VGSNFVILSQIFKENVATRTDTILYIVLKFQVDWPSFHREDALARKKGGKVEKRKKEYSSCSNNRAMEQLRVSQHRRN